MMERLRGPFEKFVDSPLGKRCTSYNAPPSSRKRKNVMYKRINIIIHLDCYIRNKKHSDFVGIARGWACGHCRGHRYCIQNIGGETSWKSPLRTS
jgi:hypothetical protein